MEFNEAKFSKRPLNIRAEYDSLSVEDRRIFKEKLCCILSIQGDYANANIMRNINGACAVSYAEKAAIFELFQEFEVYEIGGVEGGQFFQEHQVFLNDK